MCGIAGVLRAGANPAALRLEIERMTRALAHRGPDGDGIRVDGPVALGHRRLAVIDIEGGQQPLSNEDGSVWITYNGELYNYRALAASLQRAGHRFRTRSDTEVIVHAYEEWGIDCLQHLRGMFAFAVADHKRRRLFLARDHCGIKPLVYQAGPGFFAFASELSALRKSDQPPRRGSLAAVDFLLRYQYIPGPHTIFHDVHKLPPASYLLVDFDGEVSDPVRYWRVALEPDGGVSPNEWAERTEEAITCAVRAQLVADVPVGVFCSGGVDSALVAAALPSDRAQPLAAFAIGFDVPESELPYARQVAERCGMELHAEVLDENALRVLPEIVAHQGEPFADSSLLPSWHLARLARQHVTVALSGDGGDEAFGGYDSYVDWLRQLRWGNVLHLWKRSRRQALLQVLRKVRHTLGWPADSGEDWQQCVAFVPRRIRRSLWKPELCFLTDLPCPAFNQAVAEAGSSDHLGFAQAVDYETYLPGDILAKVDAASMHHGLEVRVPLLDLRVIDVARRLPLAQRCAVGAGGAWVGKPVLKRLAARQFTPHFAQRAKQGFVLPRNRWFGANGPARAFFQEVVLGQPGPLHEWFDRAALTRALAEHGERRDRSNELWALLVLALWTQHHREVHFS